MLEINKIYNMDCLEGMKLIDDESITLTVTSPPYALSKEYEKGNPKKQLDDLLELLNGTFAELCRITKKGGYVFVNFGDNAFGKRINKTEVLSTIPMSIFYWEIGTKNGFELQATRIWRKSFASMGVPFCLNNHPRPLYDFEFLWTFRKPDGIGKEIVRSHKISRRGVWATTKEDDAFDGNYETKVLKSHCAAFPESIPSNAIILYSDEWDLVLDPFMGSGTTAVSALKLNRSYIGFEKNKEYFDIAVARIDDYERENL